MALNLRRRRADPTGEGMQSKSLADEVLDEILPEEVDWRQLVWNYPKSALALAALGGYLLGRTRGRAVVNAATELVGDNVSEGFNEFFGRKVL